MLPEAVPPQTMATEPLLHRPSLDDPAPEPGEYGSDGLTHSPTATYLQTFAALWTAGAFAYLFWVVLATESVDALVEGVGFFLGMGIAPVAGCFAIAWVWRRIARKAPQ